MAVRRPQRRSPMTQAESYNVAVQFHNNEFRTLGTRTTAFLIVQSILVAAFVGLVTIPAPIVKETFGYAFYPFAFGIAVVGVLFCVLHYVAGMSGSQAAGRWRRYMRHIENHHPDAPWEWFYRDSERSPWERRQLERLPLPSAWLFSTAIFFWIWVSAIIYLVLRYMPEHGVSWHEAPTLRILIPLFMVSLSLTIWLCIVWWRNRSPR